LYERLVHESVRRYKTTKAMSKLVNELLKEALGGQAKIRELIFSKKVARASTREFEQFRRELSRRLES